MKTPRDDYLTPEGHYQEARRLLWVIDGELQSDAPRTIGELAVIALAHAITTLAADVFEHPRPYPGTCPDCGMLPADRHTPACGARDSGQEIWPGIHGGQP